MYGYIYKIQNLTNNKQYIGKHKYPKCKLDPNYITSGKIVSEAIKYYGKENFDIQIIDTAETLDELNQKEIYWIAYYNTRSRQHGYNIAMGGDGGSTTKGRKCATNGEINIKVSPNSQLPNGFQWGSAYAGVHHPSYGKKLIWLCNGTQEVLIPSERSDLLNTYISNGYKENSRLPTSENSKRLISEHHNTFRNNFSQEFLDKLSVRWQGDSNPQRIDPKFGERNAFFWQASFRGVKSKKPSGT